MSGLLPFNKLVVPKSWDSKWMGEILHRLEQSIGRYFTRPGEKGATNLQYPIGDIRRYGGVADGVKDNYPAYRDMITSAIATQIPAVIPEASEPYLISRGHEVTEVNASLTLQGYGATLKLAGNPGSDGPARMLYFSKTGADGPRSVKVLGLNFDGNSSAQPAPPTSDQRAGFFAANVEDLLIQDCGFRNIGGDGIQLHSIFDGVHSNKSVRIIGNQFDDCGRHHISCTDADGVVVALNVCETAEQGGIHFEREDDDSFFRNITITGNVISDVGNRGVVNLDVCISVAGVLDDENSQNVTIANNTCSGQGIYSGGIRYVVVSGNAINNAEGTGTDGIAIQVKGQGPTVVGNTITAPSQFGILIDNSGIGGASTYGQSQGVVSGNTIRNLPNNVGVSEGIRLQGAVQAVVQGNTIVNDAATANTWGIRFATIPGAEAVDNLVALNQIANVDYGIVEDANSARNRYLDNTITNAATARYSLVGVTPEVSQPRTTGALAYGATVNTNLDLAERFTLTVTNGTAFTMAAPTGLYIGRTVVYDILNSSGGAMGAITWNAAFKLAGAFTNPASTKRRTIAFYSPDGTSLVEVTRAAADI